MYYLNAHKLRVTFIVILFIAIGISIRFFRIKAHHEQMRQDYYGSVLSEAPCIANICPSSKNQNDVINSLIIGGFSISDQVGLIGYQMGSNNNVEGVPYGSITLDENEVVTAIDLELYDLILGTTLDVLGEPEYTLTASGCGDRRRVRTKLLYPTQGIEVTLDTKTSQRNSITLEDDNVILDIIYFSPDDYHKHMLKSIEKYYLYATEIGLSDDDSVNAHDLFQEIVPWQGLGIPINTIDICLR